MRLADGSYTSIAGQGTVSLPLSLTLSDVLHVPKFPMNLFSVSSVTNSLNCSVIFSLPIV